jgi:ABC-type transport system involved in cytochrome bd biosynthesis fused ATPase/permease subunit
VPHNRASGPGPWRGVVDPRRSRHVRATRSFIAATSAAGFLTALLIIAQAWLLADVIASTFAGRWLRASGPALLVLLAVVLARAVMARGTELLAARSASRAKGQLRAALLRHLAAVGPARGGHERSGEVATLATRGLWRRETGIANGRGNDAP